MTILGDRWWRRTAKQEEDKISKKFVLCSIWETRVERLNVGGVSVRSKNGFPSGMGCVANGQMTKARKQMSTPSPLHGGTCAT